MRNSNVCAGFVRRWKPATAALCSMLCLLGSGCATRTQINVIQDESFRFVGAGEVLTSRVDGVYMDLPTFLRIGEVKIAK